MPEPLATDVEIERVLNALYVTLNDQRLDRVDLDRLQQIATLALGGEERLRVERDAEHVGRLAWLHDHADQVVGRVELADGPKWSVERRGGPRSAIYVPSGG